MTIAARLLAILEAQTSEFDSRMAASGVVVEKMSRSHDIARRAAGQLRGSLQGVATQALGMVGPAGQAATALLSLAGGMGAIVAAGAAGGVALLILNDAKALAQFTEQADAAAAAARNLAAARIGSPLLQRLASTEGLQSQRDELEDKIRRRADDLRFTQSSGGPGFDATLEDLAKVDARLAEMMRTLAGFNSQIAETLRQPEQVLVGLRRQVQLLNLPLDQSLRLQAEWAGLVGKSVDEYVRLKLAIDASGRALKLAADIQRDFLADISTRAMPAGLLFTPAGLGGRAPHDLFGRFGPDGSGAPRFLPRDPFAGLATTFADHPAAAEVFAPREFFLSDLVKEGGKGRKPGLDASAIAAQSLALMGSLKQGGLGGILGAGGGLATALGAGAIFGPLGAALGGVFNLFDRSEERRHREDQEALRKIIQNTDHRGEPRNISVTVLLNGKEMVATIIGDVVYGIRRLEHTNGVPLLPA